MALKSLFFNIFASSSKKAPQSIPQPDKIDAQIRIDSKDYPIISLTLTECQIDNFTADLAINQKVFFTYILNFNDTISEIPARGKIIKIDGQKLTINLFKPQPYFLNELKKFVEEFSKKK